ncbi:MAG: glycosyltransferase family 4 protein, partial [Actinobacteria bacterium]|nr:glycosyltransferase family 4 protein [Actinomycetota bacterium]
MRVLMLSWEYPPRVVGGLGRHVAALSRTLAAEGHEVHVITRDHPSARSAPQLLDRDSDAPLDEWLENVHVVRVPEAPPVIPFNDLIPWVLAFNNRVQAAAARLVQEYDIDVVHAHDWLVAYAAAGVKDAFGIPLVATIHATEYGRHQGYLPGPMNKLIHQVEWWLTYEARRVITCSKYMRQQCRDIFLLPADKVDVVPNAVAVRDFALPEDEVAAFRRTLVGPRTKMVLFAGRLEYEKGIQTVLEALEQVRAAVGPVKFFIAGTGTYSDELRRKVRDLKLRN